MVGTWFEPDQPSGARLTCAVSGMSAASSGPSACSRASTSVRKRAFASSHCRVLSRRGQRRIAGSMSGSRLIGRNAPSNSNSSRSISTALCSCPASYDQPMRDHSTVCSHGAIVAVGSILM